MGKSLDESWSKWLHENLERKCNPEELFDTLIKNGFAINSIKQEMGEYYPQHSELVTMFGESPAEVDYEALSKVRITQPDPSGKITRFDTNKVQLYIVDDFMSEEECDKTVALIKSDLRQSTVTIASPDKYYRTSSTCDLGLLNNKFVESLDKKIAKTLGISHRYSETIQGQHYLVGQEFKQHTDFFSPGTQEYLDHASGKGGNRTWTFMVYLNNVAKGGGTSFFKLKHTFQPKKGMAVVWNNLYADGSPNYDTLHAGTPVLDGEKTIITKWFRETGTGDMFV